MPAEGPSPLELPARRGCEAAHDALFIGLQLGEKIGHNVGGVFCFIIEIVDPGQIGAAQIQDQNGAKENPGRFRAGAAPSAAENGGQRPRGQDQKTQKPRRFDSHRTAPSVLATAIPATRHFEPLIHQIAGQAGLGGEENHPADQACRDEQRAGGHPFLFKPGRAGPPRFEMRGKEIRPFRRVLQVAAMAEPPSHTRPG